MRPFPRRLLNPGRRPLRWTLKCAVLLIGTLFILYPDPRLLVRNVQHWSGLGALIEPTAPQLDALEQQVHELLNRADPATLATDDPMLLFQSVEVVVDRALPYDWDWNTWGAADYVPTVSEALQKGREDCDGRAVVAASLVKRFGFEAVILSDMAHVWVSTPEGALMHPRAPASGHVLVSSDRGETRLDWRAITGLRAIAIDWPSNLAYAMRVFPLLREALLGALVFLVLLSAQPRRRAEFFAAIGFVIALIVVRLGPDQLPKSVEAVQGWIALVAIFSSCFLLIRRTRAKGVEPLTA